VTFGSLNNFAKMHEGVLARWALILEAVKDSRLLLYCPEGEARERVRGYLGTRGIAPERVAFSGYLRRRGYLSLYHQTDIGLDPFPYNGMTTTCDALWMGVPVLTLPGKTPASRACLTVLSTLGLQELAASSEEEYVRIAVGLAGNLPRLAELRAALRSRMKASPLTDAPRFARNVEAAFRSVWER
jgi:predicted O-linked N-acetylglucosamine transferase (SPINDLY family)